jgi:hypothetical protein
MAFLKKMLYLLSGDSTMKIVKTILFISFVSLTVFTFNSCKNPTTPSEEMVTPPSRSLSSTEIMRIQGIASLHYVEYDSTIVNGVSSDSFSQANEYYLDTCHYKFMQYYLDNHNWNTTVYNVSTNNAWNYYNGQLTYLQLPDLPSVYEQSIQSCLGSSLKEPVTFLGTEIIEGKTCNVFKDSTGYQEWVWIKYKLPIQSRRSGQHDVYQISVIRKNIIEVNQPITGNVFDPPQ